MKKIKKEIKVTERKQITLLTLLNVMKVDEKVFIYNGNKTRKIFHGKVGLFLVKENDTTLRKVVKGVHYGEKCINIIL